MVYFSILIKLTKVQGNHLINAYQNKHAVSIKIKPSQIDREDGDMLLITQQQLNKINMAMMNNAPVVIKFSKTQINKMFEEMMAGNGILDSISSLFSRGVNAVKNVFKNKVTVPKIFKPKIVKHEVGDDYNDWGPSYMEGTKVKYEVKPPSILVPKSGFDKFADKVSGFDKSISNFFSY